MKTKEIFPMLIIITTTTITTIRRKRRWRWRENQVMHECNNDNWLCISNFFLFVIDLHLL